MPTDPSPRRPSEWPRLLLAVIVLFALACAAPSRGASPTVSYDHVEYAEYGEAGDGFDDYARSEELVVTESRAAPTPPARELGGRFKAKKLDKDAGPGQAQAPAGGAATTTATVEPEPPEAPEPAPGDAAPSTRRQIIYTAGLGLAVFEVDETMAKLEAIPDRHGGWIQQRDDERIVLRVPAAKLDAILAEISAWGEVQFKTLEALDVTAEYTDLDSRIRVLEQMEAHLRALLDRAENVEQALAIEMELRRVRAELESLRAQMRLLASAIDFSTLAVQLYPRGTEAPAVGNDPFTWVDALGAEATAYR